MANGAFRDECFDKPIDTRCVDLSRLDPCSATVLGRTGLRHPPAPRYGSRRGHLPPRHLPAGDWPRNLERCLRSAFPPSNRRPLRRKPQPPAALLPVSGGDEALPQQPTGSLPRLVEAFGARPADPRRALRGRQLGVPHVRCLGPWLGSMAQRHGSDSVHLLPAGGRHRVLPRHRRADLWA